MRESTVNEAGLCGEKPRMAAKISMTNVIMEPTGPESADIHRESAHDILHSQQNPLDSIFSPRIVAVIGATERKHSVGRTVMTNLTQGGFPGRIYPVNPIQDAVLGLRAYPNVAA